MHVGDYDKAAAERKRRARRKVQPGINLLQPTMVVQPQEEQTDQGEVQHVDDQEQEQQQLHQEQEQQSPEYNFDCELWSDNFDLSSARDENGRILLPSLPFTFDYISTRNTLKL